MARLNRPAPAAALVAIASGAAFLSPAPAVAQTDPRIVIDPWPAPESWGQTHDDLLYQGQSHVQGEDGATAQIFWWDSVGHFRFHPSDPHSAALGYRYLTMNFDTDARALPDTLDEVSLAAGLHLGEWAGGDVWAVLGAGYSGDNLFADSQGVFGIAHLLWQTRLSDTDRLVLSVDYNGVGPLLPDVPLPGFEYFHQQGPLLFEVGYPRSAVTWAATDALTFEASYEAPFTADVIVDQKVGGGFSVFGRYASFYNGFRLDGEPPTDRLFYQMSRAEIGVRYVNPHLVFEWAYFDAALSVGYAFEQQVSRGFDARETDPLEQVSDVPYVGLVLRGRF